MVREKNSQVPCWGPLCPVRNKGTVYYYRACGICFAHGQAVYVWNMYYMSTCHFDCMGGWILAHAYGNRMCARMSIHLLYMIIHIHKMCVGVIVYSL